MIYFFFPNGSLIAMEQRIFERFLNGNSIAHIHKTSARIRKRAQKWKKYKKKNTWAQILIRFFFWVRIFFGTCNLRQLVNKMWVSIEGPGMCVCVGFWSDVWGMMGMGRERESARESSWNNMKQHGTTKFLMTWSMDVCFVMFRFNPYTWWQNSLGWCIQDV